VTRHAYARATAGTPAMAEKAAKHVDLQRSEFPTIRPAVILECVACIDSSQECKKRGNSAPCLVL